MKSANEFPDMGSYREYLRIYFVSNAMQGLLSSMNPNAHGFEPNEFTVHYCVGLSIKAADDCLNQLGI